MEENGVKGTQERVEAASEAQDVSMSGLGEKAQEGSAKAPRTKKGKKWGLVMLVIVLVLALGAAGTFGVLWWQEKNRDAEVVVKEKTEVVEKLTEVDKMTTAADLLLTREKCKNEATACHLLRYEIRDNGINLGLDTVLEDFEINGNPWTVGRRFDLYVNWGMVDFVHDLSQVPLEDVSDYGKDYEKAQIQGIDPNEVVDIELGTAGQDSYNEAIFFLMKDGTVEYILMREAAQTREFHSRGRVPGMANIIRVKSISIGAAMDTMFQAANGDFWTWMDITEREGI